MSIQTFTPQQLRDTGSLKWTGITRSNGDPTIGAWVAEMDFGTAPEVAKVMKDAIDNGLLGYQPPWLEGAIQEATASFQAQRFGWDIAPSDVRLVASVLPALKETIRRCVRPGAPIIVPTPAYMPFLTIPGALDHPVIEVPSLRAPSISTSGDEDDAALPYAAPVSPREWILDLDGIRRGLEAGAGLVILCNPWNPTGRVLSRDELEALGHLVSQYDALVFSDEIHSPLIIDPTVTFTSYARLSPTFAAHTVTATAASKGWNIAGLPSAQVILPDAALREKWDTFGSEVAHGANVIGTLGAIAAYTSADAWQREVIDIIRSNVDDAEKATAGTPIDYVRPQGTYLTWWGFDGVDLGGLSPAKALREGPGIGVNAGLSLGADYAQWARINLACSPDVARTIIDGVLSLL
ncbi:aminotransferase class I/II-fold pyridoxal phosphate-dependent enzyme [Schaalia sp. ZJ1691]|uniref:MalY/PatB family protein n=1 Tax=Schaalia sp. ZJ1691 TaxID=2709404 RepID=UPI0013ED5BAC|nr:aminotransferase class I/II-fold pyridoxal phosphate-dependent enzyme [Schaalia sp. ZJ1691]